MGCQGPTAVAAMAHAAAGGCLSKPNAWLQASKTTWTPPAPASGPRRSAVQFQNSSGLASHASQLPCKICCCLHWDCPRPRLGLVPVHAADHLGSRTACKTSLPSSCEPRAAHRRRLRQRSLRTAAAPETDRGCTCRTQLTPQTMPGRQCSPHGTASFSPPGLA